MELGSYTATGEFRKICFIIKGFLCNIKVNYIRYVINKDVTNLQHKSKEIPDNEGNFSKYVGYSVLGAIKWLY
jgi:hypothetical protein